jgi:hypothetical protein
LLPFHPFGPRKMVARLLMGFSEQNKPEIVVLINDWVSRPLGMAA